MKHALSTLAFNFTKKNYCGAVRLEKVEILNAPGQTGSGSRSTWIGFEYRKTKIKVQHTLFVFCNILEYSTIFKYYYYICNLIKKITRVAVLNVKQ